MIEAPEAPHTRGGGWGGGIGLTPPPTKNLPPLEDHLCVKFCPDPSSSLDFYREQTNTHTHIALYVLEDRPTVLLHF